jgi:plastocyanin
VKLRVVAGLLAVAVGAPAAPARADAFNVVEVFNNVFAPEEIHVPKGETITWMARAAGHTVTAGDGRFSFPEGGGTLAAGQTVSWTFETDETVFYRCIIHGPGMAGLVVVGEGTPPPPPPPEPPRRLVPTPEYPTIARALIGAERGTT